MKKRNERNRATVKKRMCKKREKCLPLNTDSGDKDVFLTFKQTSEELLSLVTQCYLVHNFVQVQCNVNVTKSVNLFVITSLISPKGKIGSEQDRLIGV